jgi:hypothetical protein
MGKSFGFAHNESIDHDALHDAFTAGGGDPMGTPVIAAPVVVTGQKLPSTQRIVSREPGLPRSAADQPQARKEAVGQQRSGFYSNPANKNKSFTPDRMAADASAAKRPGVVHETTRDLITNRSITQHGFEGTDYSAEELASQEGLKQGQALAIQGLGGKSGPSITPQKERTRK